MAMDPTVKALAFVKRVTGKTIAETPALSDKLMLIDLWERELMSVRQALVVAESAPTEKKYAGANTQLGANAQLRGAEHAAFGSEMGKL